MLINEEASGASQGTRWPRAALTLLAAVNFMAILDSQIVILALPSIAADLSTGIAQSQWVMTAYLIGFGGLLLLGGRLGDRLGRRRVFLVGTGLFGAASLLCGFAWNMEVLVAGRALHGLSAALMAPTALGILITTFSEEKDRNKALAVWGGVGGMGATAALLVGGAVTDLLGWQWVFFLNVPVAAALLALAPILLAESGSPSRAEGADAAGALSITMALACACLAVVRAPQVGWLSVQTVTAAVIGLLALVVFVTVERRAAAPLIPLGTFRSRTFVSGNLVMLLTGMGAWGVGLTASLYAQEVLGYSAVRFGLGTAVLTLAAVGGSFAAQAGLKTMSTRTVAVGGTGTAMIGVLLLIPVSANGTYAADLLPGLFLFGVGLGASTVAASVVALSETTDTDAGLRSAVNTAAFQIGGALGAAIVSGVVAMGTRGSDTAEATDALSAGFGATASFSLLAVAAALLISRRDGNSLLGRIQASTSVGGERPAALVDDHKAGATPVWDVDVSHVGLRGWIALSRLGWALSQVSGDTPARITHSRRTEEDAAERAIRALVEQWIRMIASCDPLGVVAHHTDDIVMFDVPPPSGGVRGLAAYAATWPPFFDWLEREGRFEMESLTIEADGDVAFAHALVRCEARNQPRAAPADHLRLTLGLRQSSGSWRIAHEHHSFADRRQA